MIAYLKYLSVVLTAAVRRACRVPRTAVFRRPTLPRATNSPATPPGTARPPGFQRAPETSDGARTHKSIWPCRTVRVMFFFFFPLRPFHFRGFFFSYIIIIVFSIRNTEYYFETAARGSVYPTAVSRRLHVVPPTVLLPDDKCAGVP